LEHIKNTTDSLSIILVCESITTAPGEALMKRTSGLPVAARFRGWNLSCRAKQRSHKSFGQTKGMIDKQYVKEQDRSTALEKPSRKQRTPKGGRAKAAE